VGVFGVFGMEYWRSGEPKQESGASTA